MVNYRDIVRMIAEGYTIRQIKLECTVHTIPLYTVV